MIIQSDTKTCNLVVVVKHLLACNENVELGLQDGMCLLCHQRATVWCNPSCFAKENLYSVGPLRCSVVLEEKSRNLTGAHYVKPDIFISISDAPWGNFPHRLSCILSLFCFDPVTLGCYLKHSWLHQYYIREKDHIQKDNPHISTYLSLTKIEMLPVSKFRGKDCSLNYMVLHGCSGLLFYSHPAGCFLAGMRDKDK